MRTNRETFLLHHYRPKSTSAGDPDIQMLYLGISDAIFHCCGYSMGWWLQPPGMVHRLLMGPMSVVSMVLCKYNFITIISWGSPTLTRRTVYDLRVGYGSLHISHILGHSPTTFCVSLILDYSGLPSLLPVTFKPHRLMGKSAAPEL